jgi:hypothetical protein
VRNPGQIRPTSRAAHRCDRDHVGSKLIAKQIIALKIALTGWTAAEASA